MSSLIQPARDLVYEFLKGVNLKNEKYVRHVLRTGYSEFCIDNSLVLRTCSRAIIELEGQKKKLEQNIMHSYCPFCGEKIDDEN